MRVHVVAPEGFDDPGRPSGGNNYDRRVCAGLAESGWDVRIAAVGGAWPAYDRAARADLARVLTAIPDGETVLVDGLVAAPAATPLLSHARRLRLVVLLHMPLATAMDHQNDAATKRSERAVLGVVAGVVVTSEWTRREVLARFAIPGERVRVARPGVDRAGVAPGDAAGGHLLCVGTVGPHKGQDLLVGALAGLPGREWECALVGPLDRDPDFVAQLRTRIARAGLGARVRLAGTLTGTALDHAYAAADVVVVPSRSETYGMVVTEALAHGLPVIAAATGGLPEALGFADDGHRPGRLVAPDDPVALRTALAEWLRDGELRQHLRAAALRRRARLPGWDQTVRDLARALTAAGRHAAPASGTTAS
ncbi:MAG TPA: glycosyltransferase family 4 protein [Streptosporangiales bacterium]